MRKYGVSFEDDCKLNRLELDQEAELQPSLMQFYGEQLAEAKNVKDQASHNLNLKRAEVELMYRRNPPADLKVTEAVIASLVETHPDVVKLSAEVIEAKSNVYVLEGGVNAVADKGSMIKVLAQIWAQGYFAAS